MIFRLLADITRMGEFSPECYRCEWLGPERAEVGARFRGYNRSGMLRWSRLVEIVAVEQDRVFAFRTVADRKHRGVTLWRFELHPTNAGARLVQSSEVLEEPDAMTRFILRLLRAGDDSRSGMRTTLERIKSAAESGS